jgi:hypothetical protein
VPRILSFARTLGADARDCVAVKGVVAVICTDSASGNRRNLPARAMSGCVRMTLPIAQPPMSWFENSPKQLCLVWHPGNRNAADAAVLAVPHDVCQESGNSHLAVPPRPF